jgi:alpha-L-arabinofuranosidase
MNKLRISTNSEQQKINRHIYGHFAEHLGGCIYGGLWVGEDSPIPNTRGIRNDVVEALRKLNVPNLRWPGGCFADIYHWQEGIGPREKRPRIINMWGNVAESNDFGTHEFMDLCDQLGCDPYIGGNVGSGTVREMRDWLEYLTSNNDSTLANLRRQNGREEAWSIPFWGIGNENWGCGGHMTPEYYADLYCQYHTFMNNYNSDSKMMKFASGYGGSETVGEDLDIFLDRTLNRRHPVTTDGVSLHYYVYFQFDQRHSATQFGEDEWFTVLKGAHNLEKAIKKHTDVMDRYDPGKHMWLMVDEWGMWYPVEPGTNPGFLYQQNSMRDAVAAALSLHLFHDHCDRIQMANIAQVVNVLQAMILTDNEKILLTPTYHVFEMFKGHQDAMRLEIEVESETYSRDDDTLPAVSASASRNEAGEILLTLANLKPREAATIECSLDGFSASSVLGRVLSADGITAHNTFDQPDRVQPVSFDSAVLEDGQHLRLQIPAASVVALTLK